MGKHFPSEDSPVADIMTTKELSRYLRLHEITICKYAAEGQIPAIRIGRVWRFDKDVIDNWIRRGQEQTKADGRSKRKGGKKEPGKKKPRKRKR
jgi:PTS system nitrogen regulatory IIA component